MVEFSSPTILRSREDKTNPSGRLLEFSTQVEKGGQTLSVLWLDKDGDGVVTLGTDQYVEIPSTSCLCDAKPKRVDYRFFNKYKKAIDSHVSATCDAMRQLDNYFWRLRPLSAKNSTLGQRTSSSCNPTDKTYSYTAEQCVPYTVTDFRIDDQDLPYVSKRTAKRTSISVDPKNQTFSVWLTTYDPQGCPGPNNGCCNSFDVGYPFEVIGNSPDLRLIESIQRFYSNSVSLLEWRKSNNQSYPPGCYVGHQDNL